MAKKQAAKVVHKKAAKQEVAKKRAKKAAKLSTRRADFGAPIDSVFAKQPPHLKPILDALRAIIEQTVPSAVGSLKWGMPFYCVDGKMMCALGAHKAHINLILAGPPGEYDDPNGLLQGDGKSGRRLTLKTIDDLPRTAVKNWLKTAERLARSGQTSM